MNGSSERIPELDGVRGIAILMVLTFHLAQGIPDTRNFLVHSFSFVTRYGGTGVDLFFVLSGFLICGILIDNRNAGNYFKVFYVRRTLRILPLYFLIVLTYFLLSFACREGLMRGPDWLLATSLPRWTYLTFTQNFAMARAASLGGNPLAPTWSLAVEEQFYLTLPLIVWLVPRRFLSKVLLAIIVGAAVTRIAVRAAFPSGDLAVLVLMPCRADTLVVGALIAIWMRTRGMPEYLKTERAKLYGLLGLLILGLILLRVAAHFAHNPLIGAMPFRPKLIGDSIRYPWFSLIYGTFLVLALTAAPRDIIGRLCRHRVLRKVGTWAYCVYLIHMAVRATIGWLFEASPASNLLWLGEAILIVGITFLLAWLSWTYFEQPLIRYGHRFRYDARNECELEQSTTLQKIPAT